MITKTKKLVQDLRTNSKKRRELVAVVLGIVANGVIAFLILMLLMSLGFQLNELWLVIATLISMLGLVSVYYLVKRFLWVSISVAIAIFLTTMVIIWIIWGTPVPEEKNTLSIFETRLTLTTGAIGAAVLSTVGIWNLIVNYRRVNAAEKQLKQQRESDKRRDEQQLYATNVQHLGHESESVRLGAIYGLERLAKESKDWGEPWAPKIAEILCAHIRITTTTNEYPGNNKDRPSNEIDAVLRVLTQGEDNPFDSSQFDLGEANLKGADLVRANLKEANLATTNLREADLTGANLKGAELGEADLTDAYLTRANLKEASLISTDLVRTNLTEANLHGVSRLANAGERWADFIGCTFSSTDLSGIYWGVINEGVEDAVEKYWGTDKKYDEKDYLEVNAVRREPTQIDKEQLVGRENVDKCIWGDIFVLEDKD